MLSLLHECNRLLSMMRKSLCLDRDSPSPVISSSLVDISRRPSCSISLFSNISSFWSGMVWLYKEAPRLVGQWGSPGELMDGSVRTKGDTGLSLAVHRHFGL